MVTKTLDRKFRLNMSAIDRRGQSSEVMSDIMEQLVKPWVIELRAEGYSVDWRTLDISLEEDEKEDHIVHAMIRIDVSRPLCVAE